MTTFVNLSLASGHVISTNSGSSMGLLLICLVIVDIT